jgi:acetyltransferase-like isoleucine patch superfamily enzyme
MLKRILLSIAESMMRNISGGIGQRMRFVYYKRRFKTCGSNVKIDEGVIFHNPENISVGNNVWFLPYSIITARPLGEKINNRLIYKKINSKFISNIGSINIGNEIQIGSFNIIQGYGGLDIGNKVTTSSKVSIYSYSHYPFDKNNLSLITYANSMIKNGCISCIESPILIEEGCWIGLNVIVFGGAMGKNTFVTANSIVLSDLPENSYASGNPAKKIKKRFDY